MRNRKKIFFVLILSCSCILNTNAQLKSSYLQRGKNEFNQGHFIKAIEYLNISIEEKDQSFDSYFFRAMAKEQLDDYLGAEQDYSQSINIYSGWANAYVARALVRDKMFNYKGAFQDYEKAISLDSSNPIIYFNRAITFISCQKYQEAIDDCNHLERLKCNNENQYTLRGLAEAGLGMYGSAIENYNREINRNPTNIFAYLQRADAWLALSNKDSALFDLNYILKHDSVNTEALLKRALLRIDDLKYTEALNDLDKVIRLSNECASAYFNRAILKSNLNDYKGALNDYNKVIELHPQSILAYYNRAGLKYNSGDLLGALEDYNKTIALFPNFADAYYNRAKVKKDLNKAEDSKKDYNKAIEIQAVNNMLSDSAKFEESTKLMKLMALSSGSEYSNNVKEKVQFINTDIQPKSIFSVDLLSTEEKFKLYKVISEKSSKDCVLTLVNTSEDSIDEQSVLSKINALNLIIEKDSSNACNYLNRAILYSTIQRYNQSIDDYNKSILLDSSNAILWFSRANTRYKLLELLYSFEEETASAESSPNYQKRVYIDPSYEMVINDYSKALQLNPSFAYAWFNMATTKIKMKDYKGAVNDYSTALLCDSTIADVYYNRGLLCIVLHDEANACMDLSKAGELGLIESYSVMKKFCYK